MLCIASAHAQSTLGQVLTKGGTKITETQWRAMLPHRNFGFGQQSQNRTAITFTDDGQLSGSEDLWSGYRSHADLQHRSRALRGTWTMDAAGKLCVDQVFGRYEAFFAGCFFMFRSGDTIFHVDAGSESDRSAPVTRRTIEP